MGKPYCRAHLSLAYSSPMSVATGFCRRAPACSFTCGDRSLYRSGSCERRILSAHYYSGICHREMGKFKAFVLRKRDWNRAEEYFRFVLDSLDYYKDLYLQFAILQKYNKNYAEAIKMFDQRTLIPEALELAVRNKVTLYDALFIVLAKKLKIALITSDERRAEIAEKEGVNAIRV